MNTRDLTNGERITVRRRRSESSQVDAAPEAGVTLYKYRLWENDAGDPPKVSIGTLRPHEACFIMRRRADISLAELADELELSRWWLCQMEYGRANADRLVAHWAEKGRPWRPKAKVSRRA